MEWCYKREAKTRNKISWLEVWRRRKKGRKKKKEENREKYCSGGF